MISRHSSVWLSSHEVLMLAFYRALTVERRRHIDGFFGRQYRDPRVRQRFIQHLDGLGGAMEVAGQLVPVASDIRPFLEASPLLVIGLRRKPV